MDPKSLQLPHDYGRTRRPEPTPHVPDGPIPDRPVSWGLKAILWASLTSLVLIIGALIALVVLMVMVGAIFGLMDIPTMSGMDPMTGNPMDAMDPRLMLLFVVGFFCVEALLIPVAWFFGPRKTGGGLRKLGFRPMALGRGLILVCAALGVSLLVQFLWGLLMEVTGWEGQGDVLGLFGGGVVGLLAALFAGGIVAPVAEEVFFRGFIYAGLRDRFARSGSSQRASVVLGIVISSVIFALVHVTPSVLVPIWVMGILMAWLYEETDSLWAPILLHAASNSLAFLAMFAAEFVGG